MNKHVGILDYGAGNLKSLHNAFVHTGANVSLIREPQSANAVSHLVLPGVGAFGYCQAQLLKSGLHDMVLEALERQDKPVLGICVGMQMLAQSSEEFGSSDGFGICNGTITKIPSTDNERVPHVGWNEVEFQSSFGEFSEGEKVDFYFDHSYALINSDTKMELGRTTHSIPFTSLVQNDLVVGSQFHPEKSQTAGLSFLTSFLNLGA